MKNSEQIMNKIKEISIKDHQYNRLINENGEGYEVDNVPDSLREEYYNALKQEFSEEWILEVFTKRRKIWNDAKIQTIKDMIDFKKQYGWELTELKKAKSLLNVA